MILATNLGFILLSIGAFFTLARLVQGPSLADRVVATDLLLTLLVMGIGVLSARTGEDTYLIVMVIVAMVGFFGTTMVARFIERRGA